MSDGCLRCGKCCIIPDEAGRSKPCRFLEDEKGRKECAIYARRLGVEVAPGIFCIMRDKTGVDYPGCSLNCARPLHPAYRL